MHGCFIQKAVVYSDDHPLAVWATSAREGRSGGGAIRSVGRMKSSNPAKCRERVEGCQGKHLMGALEPPWAANEGENGWICMKNT